MLFSSFLKKIIKKKQLIIVFWVKTDHRYFWRLFVRNSRTRKIWKRSIFERKFDYEIVGKELIFFVTKSENIKWWIMDKEKIWWPKNSISHQWKRANLKEIEQIHPSVNMLPVWKFSIFNDVFQDLEIIRLDDSIKHIFIPFFTQQNTKIKKTLSKFSKSL